MRQGCMTRRIETMSTTWEKIWPFSTFAGHHFNPALLSLAFFYYVWMLTKALKM